jgi:predicted acetyltransferase
MNVVFRAPEPDDEAELGEAQRIMAEEGFVFAPKYDPSRPFAEWLSRVQGRRGSLGPEEIAATFEVLTLDGRLAGRVSVRHWLNASLLKRGGHIGYGVLPQYRRLGLGRQLLLRGLEITSQLGIGRVLVTCDEDNVASRRIIEGAGGVFESAFESADHRAPTRRYWIECGSAG